MLERGGNAADAMIASVLCVGVMVPWHCGAGGGGFALVRSPKGDYESINFREAAPALASENMYVHEPKLSLIGGLAVGVPGELRGLEHLHKRYGSLPWKTLFEPAILLARNGFRVIPETQKVIGDESYSNANPNYAFIVDDPAWAAVYAPNGKLAPINSTIYRPTYADTLEQVAKHGADVFYHGKLAKHLVNAVEKRGGILSLKDMKRYKVLRQKAVSVKYGEFDLFASPAPACGAITLAAMNVLSGYDLVAGNLSTHVLTESLKFVYGLRTALGDPDFIKNATSFEKAILTERVADQIREKLSLERTQDASVYNPDNLEILSDSGTSQMVAADANGLVISLTTTVNTYFGSTVMVPETGVVLNNEMNDFSIPGVRNAFGFIPTTANFIRPFKRPLSSISPAIVERNGKFYFVTGAAGGSRIISAVVQALWQVLDLNAGVAEALKEPRLHDQVSPAVTTFEYAYDNATVAYMADKGHNVSFVPPGMSIVMGVRAVSGGFDAAADPRRVSSGASVV
ncbi:gamma-glutamyltransferase [Protomyces lactucae-debilis]|uniref:Gamma-glutamyltransferase n=1 Tax=Protomyces lactucae-debilis TaxID=2754530 RepID=A0A1Y2FEI1_PROLT|nr:gamma-glutamyltransferase [Protomyces lactucae-debilis]ORY82017.1 gamma-glutamyltransferase [Protomyces lactucae-debilis]